MKIIHFPVGKAMGNLLGCLYIGCVGCRATQSLLLFEYVLVLWSKPLDLHLGGLLGGISAGWGGLYGLSMIGFAVSRPLFISFLYLRIEATVGDQEIEVHHCCCPGGFLGGLSVGWGGLGLIYNIEVMWFVVLHLFTLHQGCHRC